MVRDIYKRLGDELFSPIEVQRKLNVLVRDIEDWALPGPLTLVPTLPGGIWACAEILRRLKVPVIVNPFSLIDREKKSFYLHSNMEGKVLIVTDVIDSGVTLDEVGKVVDSFGAQEARIFALIHKGKVASSSILVHYPAFQVPKNSYVVGSGMDFQGLLANIPGIRNLKQ